MGDLKGKPQEVQIKYLYIVVKKYEFHSHVQI